MVVWGNGGCANSPSGHVNFLNEVASQGYLIVAIGPSNYQQVEGPRPGQTGAMPGGRPQMRPGQGGQRPQGAPQGAPQGGERPRMRPGGGMPQMPGGMSMGDPAGLKQALEWVLAQNADPASPYYGKLDIDNIAAAGMSCGGLQALHMSDDARIKTILVMNSGFFNGGNDKASLNKMKQKSVIWILGGTTDIAWENGLDDFKQLQGAMPAFLASLDGIGHGGTYMQPFGGDYAPRRHLYAALRRRLCEGGHRLARLVAQGRREGRQDVHRPQARRQPDGKLDVPAEEYRIMGVNLFFG